MPGADGLVDAHSTERAVILVDDVGTDRADRVGYFMIAIAQRCTGCGFQFPDVLSGDAVTNDKCLHDIFPPVMLRDSVTSSISDDPYKSSANCVYVNCMDW
jgi:hypothetical protein